MTNPLNFLDSFAEDGVWWIPGNADHRLSGRIAFEPTHGASLKTLGFFFNIEDSINDRSKGEVSAIHGVTESGKKVTLASCYCKNRNLKFPGISTETWNAGILLLGTHAVDSDENIFGKSYLRFEGIEEWLGHKTYRSEFDWVNRSVAVSADPPVEKQMGSNETVSVSSAGYVQTSEANKNSLTISGFSHLVISPRKAESANWHLKVATQLQGLASLCTGHHLPLTSLHLEGRLEEEVHDGSPRFEHVMLFARILRPEPGARPSHEPPMVSRDELMDANEHALLNWLEQYNNLQSVLALFFTVAGEKALYVDVRFSLAMQALESFHRNSSVETVMPEEQFKALHEQLCDAIPTGISARMKERLMGSYRFMNDLSLGQRLRFIVRDLAPEYGPSPAGFTKSYIKRLVDTRNYYTHHSLLPREVLNQGEMHWACRRVVLLLTVLFLKRLGIPASTVLELLQRHDEFRRLWTSTGVPPL